MERMINLTIDNKRDALRMLTLTTSMSFPNLECWLSLDEFVNEVYERRLKGLSLDDQAILEITERLFDKVMKNRKMYPGFKRQGAARGIRELKLSLGKEEVSS